MSLHDIFSTSLTSETANSITTTNFLICIGVSLALGLLIAGLYTIQTRHSKSFVLTLAAIPAVVCMIIMMVNGNIGAGVAVAGTFSLIRFRSVPGTAKEIGAIFSAMGTGLATGMGYIGFALLFTLIVSGVNVALTLSPFGSGSATHRTLTITIPESLDYTGVFDDLFQQYTTTATLSRVKTTNMGSLFKVTYDIDLKCLEIEKKFIDEIRCRNGNLEIVMAKETAYGAEL